MSPQLVKWRVGNKDRLIVESEVAMPPFSKIQLDALRGIKEGMLNTPTTCLSCQVCFKRCLRLESSRSWTI